jgi:hypothetical protein
LFALVGIAGEDDLDAPDTPAGPPLRESQGQYPQEKPFKQPQKPTVHRPPLLNEKASGALRDVLLTELRALQGNDALTLWAQRRLPAKNTLIADDSRVVESTYRSIMEAASDFAVSMAHSNFDLATAGEQTPKQTESEDGPSGSVVALNKPIRRRSKAHLAHVRAQARVICQRQPCDAHHVKFAEPRAMGRKVSDEFTVPMCRDHHTDLHRHGNEMAWWTNLGISPLKLAKDFWLTSPIHADSNSPSRDGNGAEHQMAQP